MPGSVQVVFAPGARTARLPISLTALGRNEFEVRYRFVLPEARLDCCPLSFQPRQPMARRATSSNAISPAVNLSGFFDGEGDARNHHAPVH